MDNHETRNPKCKAQVKRDKYLVEVISECLSFPRCKNDDDTCKGIGGILPRLPTTPKKPSINNFSKSKPPEQFAGTNKGEAYILIGCPASGKSTLSQYIADTTHSAIADSDLVKMKMPEYYDPDGKYDVSVGASIVHKESQIITDAIVNQLKKHKINLVIPTIGRDFEKVLEVITDLDNHGYSIAIILVKLEKRIATMRALGRFLETGRYVPLGYTLDTCGHESETTFYRLFAHFAVNYPDKKHGFLSVDGISRPFELEFQKGVDKMVENLIDNGKLIDCNT